MLLTRLLMVAIVVFAVIYALRLLIAGFRTSSSIQPSSPDLLVQDPVCGTYVAQECAIREGGHFFCSEECRRKMRS
jgi:hypothetical protein